MAEARNIVICCDGTSNEFARDLTSVAKLTYALVKDPERQIVYYHPGVGTMAAPGFPMPVGNWLARAGGLAFGYGLQADLRDVYCFIMEHWRPGDRLYLFGFSRGAYTVRALTALLRLYGLAMPGNLALIPYAIRMLWSLREDDPDRRKRAYQQADQFKASLSVTTCRPYFLGVWDTVSSVGWIGSPVALPYTRRNDEIAIIRHAVALDERRAFFRTNLFTPAQGQDLVELWFPGVHCDVGGGWPESESGISKYPLAWMIAEAMQAGLLVDDRRRDEILGRAAGSRYAPASADAPLHAMPLKWYPAEFVPKAHWDAGTGTRTFICNRFRRRTMPAKPLVHPVAWEIKGYSATLPADAVPYAMTVA